MTGSPEKRVEELERLVGELRRINRQLGQKLTGLEFSRQPRSPVAAARALTKARDDEELARSALQEARQQLREARSRLDHYSRENERLSSEVNRLRVGLSSLLRRTLARLLRR